MRIALVSRHVNNFREVPQYVGSLARALAKSQEVSIFSETFEGLEGTGVQHRPVQSIDAESVPSLVPSELTPRYDIVHSHHYDYPFKSDVITSHYCEREGLHRANSMAGRNTYGDSAVLLESAAKTVIERRLLVLHNGKPLIVLSRRMKSEFIRHRGIPSEQIFVVPSGVDSDKYHPRNAGIFRQEVRQSYDVGPNEPLVLFVGGDWQRKGVAQAIEALSRVDSLGAKLMILGPGDIKPYQQLAMDLGVEDRVVFAGTRTDVWKYYAASDVLLLPMLYESFGLVILEAMAPGLPVLASRDAGAAELVRDGADGLLINDPTDVAEISMRALVKSCGNSLPG